VRFLVDESPSWKVARELAVAGHDAVHVYDVALDGSDDRSVLAKAEKDKRILPAEDTDFGTLLAMQDLTFPSLILFRVRTTDPAEMAELLMKNLPMLEEPLQTGAIAVIKDAFICIRRLPMGLWEDNT
jgi:predicted nuclease of predicted toxin-antitoxin system